MLRRIHYRLLPGLLLLSACAGGERAATTANPETTTMATRSENGEMTLVKPAATAAGATNPASGSTAATTQASVGSAVSTTSGQSFGAPLSPTGSVLTTAELIEGAAQYQGQTVVVTGQVVEVCQTKGCWMTFMEGDKEMRIRFKDYAFFVPKDCGGRTARIEGVFEMKEVPVDEARHYLEDAGKPEEAAKITEPTLSYTFMASGVVIEP